MNNNCLQIFQTLLNKCGKGEIVNSSPLPISGSSRSYYRLYLADNKTIIGAYNNDVKENIAFFVYTRFFLSQQLNVPQLFQIDDSNQYYLLEDLGDITLFSFLSANRQGTVLNNNIIHYYKKVLDQLILFQLSGTKGIDFSVAYPRAAFDRQSMQWDLNYFKYYFLKLAHIPFNEQLLENDFDTFINFLLEADSGYFLYRDFQSRNIMLRGDDVYFIDYQGGRKGALQYDLASLLYDGKAAIPPTVREELLDYYLTRLKEYISVDKEQFIQYYTGFALIRIMQALGSYGYRGYYEKKRHFLQSIPYGIENIRYLLSILQLPIHIPALLEVLQQLVQNPPIIKEVENERSANTELQESSILEVEINSFSYKSGVPRDMTEHGGGFVFDCRCLPNPGREKAYRLLTGKDKEVITYLEACKEVSQYKTFVFGLIDMAVENYIERKFTHLTVSFGCTGGQHRSVYFAEELAKHIQSRESLPVKVKLIHKEQK